MKTRTKKIIGWSVVALVVVGLIVGIILTDGLYTSTEDISEVMKDAVLHEENQVDIFGFKRTQQGIEVNPSASESLQIDLYDPQSFWNGAFDRNWLEYGW